MNRIYRLVFNRALGLMQVAAETARTHAGHAGRGGAAGGRTGRKLFRSAASLPLLALALATSPARADCEWIGGAGSWFDPNMWQSHGVEPCPGIPTDSDWVEIRQVDSDITISGGQAYDSSFHFRAGRVHIVDGGVLNSSSSYHLVGHRPEGAELIVSGAGSAWNVRGAAWVGRLGTGSIRLTDGGLLNFTHDHHLILGYTASSQQASHGTLIIGAGTGEAPAAPGSVATPQVEMGLGDDGTRNATGLIVFNHTDTSGGYVFRPDIQGTGQVQHHAGTTMYTGTSSGVPWNVLGGTLQLGDGTVEGSITGRDGGVDGSDGGSAVTMDGDASLILAGGTVTGGQGDGRGGDGLGLRGDGNTVGLGMGTAVAGGDGGSEDGGRGIDLQGNGNIVTVAGSVSGGLSGNGASRANAVEINGAGNTLELRAGYAFTGDVVAGGAANTLAFGGADDAGFDVSLLGDGGQYRNFDDYLKTGAGTWTLAGNGSGGQRWTIDAGTLVGAAASFGTGDIVNHASLVIDQAGDGTLANAVSGDGNLSKTGAGTLTLDGTNTHAGGTSILAGTLVGAASGFGTGDIHVDSGASLWFDQANDDALAGRIDGTGSVIKEGAGTLTLAGDHAMGRLYIGRGAGAPWEPLLDGGTVQLRDGATLEGSYLHLGGPRGRGVLDLAGEGTRAAFSVNALIGDVNSEAELHVSDGAVLENGEGRLGQYPGSQAVATVSGAGSLWHNRGRLDVGGSGQAGQGSLYIEAGGRVESGAARVGYGSGGIGEVTVTGTGSAWETQGQLELGRSGVGTLLIDDGATVTSRVSTSWITGRVGIGISSGGRGHATIRGGGTWVNDGLVAVGESDGDEGVLTLADGGRLRTGAGSADWDQLWLASQSGSSGILNIGAAAGGQAEAAGVLESARVELGDGSATLQFNHTGEDYRFEADLASTGNGEHLILHHAGTTVLAGDGGAFDGWTDVSGGTLRVDGALGGSLAVRDGATLGGTGTVGDAVVEAGGSLAPGGLGVLHVDGALALHQGAVLDFGFGAAGPDFTTPGDGDSVSVTGDLAIEGVTLAVSDAGGFGPGLYRLFDYGGALHMANGGLLLDPADAGTGLHLQYLADDGRINLLNTTGMTLNFWNANGLATPDRLGGGSGTWSNTAPAWTDAVGSVTAPMQPQPGFAIFGGDPGTVTIDGGDGDVAATGLQFVSDGYRLSGDALTLVAEGGDAPEIRVGDGGADSDGLTAVIDAAITGEDGLRKTGDGTLVLEGANAYAGATVVEAGTLRAGAADALIHNGAYAVEGGTLDLGGYALTMGALSGAGGAVAFDGARLTLDLDGDAAFAGTLSGSSTILKQGAGTFAFSGALTGGGLSVREGSADLSGATLATDRMFGINAQGAGTLIQAQDATATGTHEVFSALQGGTVRLHGGSVAASGDAATGVYVQADGSSAQLDGVTVTADGADATGVRVDDGGTLVVERSSIETTGDRAFGVVGFQHLADHPVTLTVADTQVRTQGEQAHGLFLSNERAGDGQAAASDASFSDGAITATGANASGVYVRDAELVLTGSAVTAHSGAAVQITRGGAVAVRGGTLSGGTAAARIGLAGTGDAVLTLHDGAQATSNDGRFVVVERDVDASGTVSVVLEGGAEATGSIVDLSPDAGTTALAVQGGARFTGDVAGLDTVALDDGTWRFADAQDFVALDVRQGGGTLDTGAGSGVLDADIGGSGALAYAGTGSLRLNGDGSGFAGNTAVVAGGTLVVDNILGGSASVTDGRLVIDGTLGGDVEARAGGALSGAGTIRGDVDLAGGGALSGAQGRTLRIDGDVAMDAHSVVDVSLGGASVDALFDVGGDLTLGGTLNVADQGGFGIGVYRLFDYGGTLTDDGWSVGATPADVEAGDLQVQTSVARQVNLVSTAGAHLGFWDGGDAALHDNGSIDGGSGRWHAKGRNWTDREGAVNGPFQPNPTFAVFQGSAGTVDVEASTGSIAVTGMQFAADGYRIEGDAIALEGAGGRSIVRVGDGTMAGADFGATIASVLTGDTALVKSDHGTLVLEGANAYTGGTFIEAGTLSVAADASLGDAAGGLTLDGGALAATASFDSARAIALAGGAFDVAEGATLGLSGTVSGDGALSKIGAGTLRLDGANSHAGGTLLQAGTLIGAAGNFGSGAIANHATLVIDQADDGTLTNAISGDGDLTKTGDGALLYSGDGVAFTGRTFVETGGLAIGAGAHLGGTVAVAAGSWLGGTGTIGGLELSGTLATGHSIGTLSVSGDAVFRSGAVWELEVDAAGNADRLAVDGRVAIEGGSVFTLAEAGTWAPHTDYAILTAGGGIDGEFDAVTASLAFLDPRLSYGGDAITLSLERNDIGFPDIVFPDAALTRNQKAAAAGAESLGEGRAVHDAVVMLPDDGVIVRAAFDALSGEAHAAARGALLDDARFLREAIGRRLDGNAAAGALLGDGGVTLWVDGGGRQSRIDGDGNAAELRAHGDGIALGADARLGERVRVGAAVGTNDVGQRIDDRAARADADGLHLGLYAQADWGRFSLSGGATRAEYDLQVQRRVAFGHLDQALTAGHDATATGLFAEAALGFGHDAATATPYLALAHVRLKTDTARESGGEAALDVAAGRDELATATLGLRSAWDIGGGQADRAVLRAGLGWRHAWGDLKPGATAAFAGGDAFTVFAPPLARNSAVFDLDLSLSPSVRSRLGLGLHGRAGNGVREHGARVHWQVQF